MGLDLLDCIQYKKYVANFVASDCRYTHTVQYEAHLTCSVCFRAEILTASGLPGFSRIGKALAGPVERGERDRTRGLQMDEERELSEGSSLFGSPALPSSNLLVLCHVINLLKGQTFHTLHHTDPSNSHFLQSLALSFFFFYTQTYI